MNKPRIYVDFNELVEPNLVLLSKEDERIASSGERILLFEGLLISVYMDDLDENGVVDNLIAEGVVERNPQDGWSSGVKWCCRIDESGIRNESASGDAI